MAIVFDTYAWIEYFNGTNKGEIVRKYMGENEILTPVIVLLELSYKADKEGWNFKDYLKFIKLNSEIVGINEKFVLLFGDFYNKIKKSIKKIGITDIIILHTANINDAKILTGDKHFEKIDNVIML
ncbi:MAG: PIN domain-containing protein [Nanoarchaeota archaeon]